MKKNRAAQLALCLAVAITTSCSLDYEQGRMAEDIPGDTPETILIDFTHTIVSGGRVWVILEAERAESYSEREEIALEGIYFREYDGQGNLITEAQAEKALFHTGSEDASVTGSIVIYSPKEEAALQASQLTWTREGRHLRAAPELSVRLQKDDGSFVEGRGFSADFRRKKLGFASRVRGSYVREEDDE